MRNLVIFFLLLVSSCTTSHKADSEKDSIRVMADTTHLPNSVSAQVESGRCDIGVVSVTEKLIDSLSFKEVYDFLYTFDSRCSNNVEFGEYGNSVLYKVLVGYPTLFSSVLKKDSINTDVIIGELANPVSEMENPQQVIDAIKSLDLLPQDKDRIIMDFKSSLGLN